MGTKKPSGLSIARSNGSLTLSWKTGEKYDKQEFEYKHNKGKWSKADSLGKTTKKKSHSMGLDNYYPVKTSKLTSVSMRVRGKKGKKWSDWADKTFSIKVPNNPSVTVAPDENLANVCRFSWSVSASDSAAKIFRNIEYQTMLVADCNETDGSKLSWKSSRPGWREGLGNATGTVTTTEDTSDIATGSHTRWFRIRSRGPAGAGDWKYAKRVYAAPFQAVITKAEASKTAAGGYQLYVEWNNSANAANPTDTMIVEYAKAVPSAGLNCPGDASWNEVSTSKRKAYTNAVTASIDGALADDECLFIRVNTVHLDKIVYGAPKAAGLGVLKSPEITNINTDDTTHRAIITAANNSEVPDSFLVVLYRTSSSGDKVAAVGIIPQGDTAVTVQCPDWSRETSYAFGVYAAVGSYTEAVREDGITSYAVTPKMRSVGEVWQGGSVPNAPRDVTAVPTSIEGTIRVSWDWPWRDASVAVLSWADHEDAWESTNEPSTYTVDNIHASEWNISGLETGVRWFVRVRLGSGTGENITYGPWSEAAIVDLASAPAVPSLSLSAAVIPEDGSITAFWTYVTTDGTGQAYAEICEAEVGPEGINYGDVIADTKTTQHVTITADEAGWRSGETHYLCVRVLSGSGRLSDSWSDPVPIIIAEPLHAAIAESSFVEETVTDDGVNRDILSLKSMPFSITVTGAGTGGTTTVVIERAENYHVDRPDETEYNGFEGEVIALETITGESEITITRDELLGVLDDGAHYRIVATVKDGLGQSDEVVQEFEVHWTHQAVMPEAVVEIRDTVCLITPILPEGALEGDSVDIYRLSADKPELIVEGGVFGTTYVDPYPAIGEYGGHRVVFRTIDGDYITADNEIAWIDLGADQGDILDLKYGIIDFDGEQIQLFYDATQSSSWEKDFKETRYLGGAIQGDWNKAVGMTSKVDVSAVTVEDISMIKAMRRLAAYPGICHLRTLDGASFSCDIQISENRNYGQNTLRAEYSISATRVDPEGFDGETYESWSE